MLEWLRDLVGPAGDGDAWQALAPTMSERAEDDAACSSAERADVVMGMAGMMAAAHAELLDAVVAADAQGDVADDGAPEAAAWLVGMCNLSTRTAREWVRVARALQSLPCLREEYASGRLSWEQVRCASWFVTPEIDAAAAPDLAGLSVSQLQQLARRHRPRPDDQGAAAQRRRQLSIRPDHARGGYTYRGFLPASEGAAVNARLLAHAETAGRNPETGTWDPLHIRLADALVDLLTGGQRVGSTDAGVVVIHADAAEIDGHEASTATLGELALHRGGVLAALCDSDCEVHLHGPDGATIGVGRARRRPPGWMRRYLHRRDNDTCRFRCGRPIRHLHHVEHWSAGGPTEVGNLVGLCWFHHHLVHEGGWTIEGDPEGEMVFVSPTGRRVASRAQPASPDARHLVRQALGHDDDPVPASTRRSGP